MSRASTSLDLSEFFNNDDSDGHRLAEFLQKRRGGIQRQNFLFMNCEPQRLSLNVQLEKLPPPQQEAVVENNEKQIVNVEECINNEDPGVSVEKEMEALHAEVEAPLFALPSCSNSKVNDKELEVPNVQKIPEKPVSPIRSQSPFNPLSPSRPLSPRLSTVRKSGGGISPGDRLRRYSLKRLSKMCVGRRTLLQEFESTVSDSNFEPPVCSTPFSQPLQDKTLVSTSTSNNSPGAENFEPNTIENNSPSTNESCCGHTDTLIRTLQRKDEELKNYMESILENTLKKMQIQEKGNSKSTMAETNTTKSPLKRTYTVERGNSPGQVILTPDRGSDVQSPPPHSRLLRSRTQPSPSKILKTTPQRQNRSTISIRVKSPQSVLSPRHLNKSSSHVESKSNKYDNISHRAAKMLKVSQNQQQPVSPNFNLPDREVPNTPPHHNVSIVFPTQDVEIPETQEVPVTKENSIIIQSENREFPVVVIPVNRSFNRTYGEEISNKIITAKTKQTNTTQQTPKANDNNNDQCSQQNEDNIKLTDILTDDEEETPKATVSRTLENNSQAPLNLAPSATNIRTKRLRKRSFSRRKLQMNNSQQLVSTETETEPPPQAHTTNRRMVKRKHLPLNRAPGTPLNGEKFAQELARMSNYEILDLRKRNSMGRVFAISGRKSSVRRQEEATKKQNQLDNQIEMELLRRNLDDTKEKQIAQNLTENNEEEVDQYPPAPDEFRDSLTKQQSLQDNSSESSLIDERSTDRISFKNKNNLKLQNRRSAKAKMEKPLPEVLKQYLEVSKMFSQKKKRKSSIINKSKRSLYTQGHSDAEESNSSPEKSSFEKPTTRYSFRNTKQSISYVSSPPKSDGDQITTLKVVSPPPSLNISKRKTLTQLNKKRSTKEVEENNSTRNNNVNINEALPPPLGFESDSGVSSNNFNIHHSNTITSNNTLQTNHNINSTTTHEVNKNNSHTDNDDEQIFKKPMQPAPRARGRKPKVSKTSLNDFQQSTSESQESTDNNTNTTDGGSLRRSKRGQVPLKHPVPIFQMLFQQTFNKRMETLEKNMQRQKQKTREMSKANRVAKHDNNLVQSMSRQKYTTKKRNQLPTVPESDSFIAPLVQDVDLLTKKKAPKIKESKVKRKQNKNSDKERIQMNDHFECSRIVMNTPPPVDHLNNVFDQLRNTSCTLHTLPPAPSEPPITPMQLTSSSRELVKKVKPLKVRVARIKTSSQTRLYDAVHVSSSITSTTTSSTINNNNSNYELISWLKNISESDNSVTRNEEIFKEMRISAASNLSFTELQGVEYAFYDTDEKASLGYLRFKPRQIKPKKKAKRFHLHFVTLVGNFRITANDKESRIGVGDMVAIEKSVYYDIENVTDDIGILMVIKK